MSSEDLLGIEARVISYYLIKDYPSEDELGLYVKAVGSSQFSVELPLDRRIMELSIKHPWMLHIFDAGLSVSNPKSVIRRKIFTMLAILEASPHHFQKFLAVKYSKLKLIMIGLQTFFSAFKSAIGFLALKSYGVLWR